jgi:hypothetical protein
VLSTAIATEAEGVKDFVLGRVGDGLAIHVEHAVGAAATATATTGRRLISQALYLLLVEQPFVGEDVAAVHTTDGNDHGGREERGKGMESLYLITRHPFF